MGKTILAYILGFTFSFVTIFEGMYVLSKVYPGLFKPVSKSKSTVEVDTVVVQKKNDTLGIIWEDTSSIGLEYIEKYKYDSLKQEYDKLVQRVKELEDSIAVLNMELIRLKLESGKKDKAIAALQERIEELKGKRKKEIAKIYESMDPKAAAKILANLSEDEVLEIILNMKRRQAAKILAELNARKAAKITQLER